MEIELTQDNYTKEEVSALMVQMTPSPPPSKSPQEVELDERMTKLLQREKAVNCKSHGIPDELALFLTDDADFEKIGLYLKEHQTGYVPTNHKKTEQISKADFQKLSYSQRAKLYAENPELIQTLI